MAIERSERSRSDIASQTARKADEIIITEIDESAAVKDGTTSASHATGFFIARASPDGRRECYADRFHTRTCNLANRATIFTATEVNFEIDVGETIAADHRWSCHIG